MNDWSGWDQAEAEVFLDDEVTPLTYTLAADSEGNPQETYVEGEPVPFMLQQDTDPLEQTVGGRVEAIYPLTGYLPLGTALTARDRLRHSSGDLQVLGSDAGRTGAALLRVSLARLGESN